MKENERLIIRFQVYKPFPYYPSNGTFDPQLSLNQQDVDFLVENGFSIVRLYVAWQGVEPAKGEYNSTYLEVRHLPLTTVSTYSGVSW